MRPSALGVRMGATSRRGTPFDHPAFYAWGASAGISHSTILEPFAGANSLIGHLRDMGLCQSFVSFDIAPASPDVLVRDTLADFPTSYDVCVTNPPWLAKNSATVRGISFPDNPVRRSLQGGAGKVPRQLPLGSRPRARIVHPRRPVPRQARVLRIPDSRLVRGHGPPRGTRPIWGHASRLR